MLNYYDLSISFSQMSCLLPENAPEAVQPALLPKPHCLILAADENTRFLYKTLLELWNYEVTEAATVEETIRLTELKRPHVILMDTYFDFSDSLLVMKKLKTEDPLDKIPFILLSGHAQPQIRKLAIAAGARDLCVKPVDFNLLEKILKSCLSYSN